MMTIFRKKKNDYLTDNNDLNLFFEDLRKREYNRLDKNKQVYLDYTGGNLHAASQLNEHCKLLSENVFGNPHSTNPTSSSATKLVEEARNEIINFFNAEDYFCIFTQNASGGLKIVGEYYPFDKNGCLLLLADNHNSVNGIREYCKHKGSHHEYATIQYEDLQINSEALEQSLNRNKSFTNKLFAFPAQSNVSGVKHDLNWIEKAQNIGWDVLLDAAAFVPTNKLDLSKVKPDFVTVSFYKIFGYPTGIGCLLVRKDKFDKLDKYDFAGGNVTLVSIKSDNFFLTNDHEKFENGTINYLNIPAVTYGLRYIQSIGIEKINKRVAYLTQVLYQKLISKKHSNGKPLVKIFGPEDRLLTGGTIIFNIFNKNGVKIPFETVEEKANSQFISIRSGCFCNPGIDEINNCLTGEELSHYYTSRDRGDYRDMMVFLNKMRGSTRVSLGIATNIADIETFEKFIDSWRDV
jgi:selenocysteine lyase/cysteine desulfurase